MIAFAMIAGQIPLNRVPERCVPKEDHPIQTFFLDGTDNPPANAFKLGFWRAAEKRGYPNTLSDEHVTKSVGVFCVAIENQIPLAAKEAIAPAVMLHAICVIHEPSGEG
jgi:hypothetical protein